jgi:hypothetical protein
VRRFGRKFWLFGKYPLAPKALGLEGFAGKLKTKEECILAKKKKLIPASRKDADCPLGFWKFYPFFSAHSFFKSLYFFARKKRGEQNQIADFNQKP